MAEEKDDDTQPEETTKKYKRAKNRREDCIYIVGPNLFTVIVQRKVGTKIVSRKARNIKGIQAARNKKKEFLDEIAEKRQHFKRGKLTWAGVYEAHKQLIRRRIANTAKHKKPMGEAELRLAELAYNFTEHWADSLVNEIKADDVWAILEDPIFKTRKYGTKKHYLRHIRAAFKEAMEAGMIHINPAAGVFAPQDKDEAESKTVWVPPEYVEAVIADLHEEDMTPKNFLGFAILLSFRSGLRSGEAYGLVWGDIKLDVIGKDGKPKAFIKLKHTFNWKTKTLTPTKSGHERTIDVSAIRDYLLERKGTQADKDWVFPRNNQWAKGKMASLFRAALKDVGYKPDKKTKLDENGNKIEIEEIPNWHSLRVGYIMNALSAGIPHLVVMSQAGHNEYRTTRRYISKLEEKELEAHDTSIKIEEFIKRTARKKVG